MTQFVNTQFDSTSMSLFIDFDWTLFSDMGSYMNKHIESERNGS
jgi:hypothetical protein